jgi:FKBP-type peptidyl-prolyl cis-trans isomerase (trigger factor)
MKRLKTALALRTIRDIEKIEVSESDIDEELKKMLAQYGGNPEIEQALNQREYRDYLANILTSRKVIEHLKSKMVE